MTMKSTHSAGPFAPLFAQTLASVARSAALIRLLARKLAHSRAHGKDVYVYELNVLISNPPFIARVEKGVGVFRRRGICIHKSGLSTNSVRISPFKD